MRKITRFFREAYAELRKVVWPTRRRAAKLTMMVVTVTVAMSAFLATVDYGLNQGIKAVIDSTQKSETQSPTGNTAPAGAAQPIQIPGGDASTTQQVPAQQQPTQ
jgi:preprotein translocase subunit SecE